MKYLLGLEDKMIKVDAFAHVLLPNFYQKMLKVGFHIETKSMIGIRKDFNYE